MKKKGKILKRITFFAVSLFVVGGAIFENGQLAYALPTNFKTQNGGIYDGMPLFDGDANHLDEYLDTYLEYVGLEGKVLYAIGQRNNYTLKRDDNKNKGKTIPGGMLFQDAVQGVKTDFPAMISMGQTWNSELIEEIGKVYGNEKLVSNNWTSGNLEDVNVNLTTAISDMRINPLSGRFDESIAEDLKLTSDMVSALANGASGIYEDGNTDNFWTKAAVTTKHYTNYAAQIHRQKASTDMGARSMLEYHAQSPLDAIKSGAVTGVMTSYGRSNGIPNMISPLVSYAQSLAPWGKDGGIYNVPDYLSSNQMYTENVYSNGVDSKYTTNLGYTVALSIVAKAGGLGDQQKADSADLVNTVIDLYEAGAYGLTLKEIEYNARAHLIPLIRAGVFNEKDSEGYPVNYPFIDDLKNPAQYGTDNEATKETALKAAQEGIVLLKNNNDVLPLDKDSKLSVVGPLSDVLFKTTYAVKKTPELENAGLTAVQGIEEITNSKENIAHSDDGAVSVFKSAATGKYLSFDPESEDLNLVADKDVKEEASQFLSYAWGQAEAFSYLSLDNNMWIKLKTEGGNWMNPGTPVALQVNGKEKLTSTGDLSAGGYTSTLPDRIRAESNEDGTVSFVLNSYSESFVGTPEAQYYTGGRYLKVDKDTGKISFTESLKNAENAKKLKTEDTKFYIENTQETGSDAVNFIESNGSEYAVVVVGAPTRHSSGEGMDRSDLYLGADQYKLVDNVSKAYPGKTIVVINSSYPVIAEEIQNNDNVAAVLYQSYGGQYAGYALGQVLYGDATPTGKLTSTWYANMDAFRVKDSYSIPEGTNQTLSNDTIDPRHQYDLSTGDPQETGLTYMYSDADVTYEFGYGLTYTNFEYSGLNVSEDANKVTATLNVKNTGNTDSKEIVELYVTNNNSAYGKYAPKLKLASYDKVSLKAGETKKVTLTFDKEDIAIWDTNAQKLVVESGEYLVQVGSSSKDIRLKTNMNITGESIGTLDATTSPVNVYDHSFASSHVTYREASRNNTVTGLQADKLVNGYYSVMGRQNDSWTALNDIDLNHANGFKVSVATLANAGILEVHLDSPDGPNLGTVSISNSGVSSYQIEAKANPDYNVDVNEVGYQDVEIKFDKDLAGVHDVYIVFKSKDMRIDTIQFTKSDMPSKDELQQLVNECKELKEEDYSDGWDGLQAALSNAQKVLDAQNATQDDVNNALNDLKDAKSKLVLVNKDQPQPVTPDDNNDKTPNEGNKDGTVKDVSKVNTGDSSPIVLLGSILVASVAIALFTVKRKRESKYLD